MANTNRQGRGNRSQRQRQNQQNNLTPSTAPFSPPQDDKNATCKKGQKSNNQQNTFDRWLSRAGSVFAIIFGGAVAVVGYLQWSVYRQQATIMQADHRPWVTLDSTTIKIQQPLTFDNAGGATVIVTGKFKNGGKSPAINVSSIADHLHLETLLPENVPLDMPQVQRSMKRALDQLGGCDEAAARRFTNISGALILPNMMVGWMPEGNGKITSKETVKKTSAGLTSAWLGLCIVYQDDSGAYHWTPLILDYVNSAGYDSFTPAGIIDGTFEILSAGSTRAG